MKASFWKWFTRREAVEPIFVHLKSDHRLDWNHLQGEDGDRMNAILSGCGSNLRKLLRAFFLPFSQWLFWRYFDHSTGLIGSIMTEDHLNTIPVRAL